LYSLESINCQKFIIDNLKANKLLTPTIQKFVMQDAGELLQHDPTLISVFKKITDVGALMNVVKEGRGISEWLGDLLKGLSKLFQAEPATVDHSRTTAKEWDDMTKNNAKRAAQGKEFVDFLSKLTFLK
jgi:hypothetical protein